VGTPPFKTFTLPSVQKPFAKVSNFGYTCLEKFRKKIAESVIGQGGEVHNETISL
jgi:hypothetical protein